MRRGSTVLTYAPVSRVQRKRNEHLGITVEPLLYDHPQNHIGVVV